MLPAALLCTATRLAAESILFRETMDRHFVSAETMYRHFVSAETMYRHFETMYQHFETMHWHVV